MWTTVPADARKDETGIMLEGRHRWGTTDSTNADMLRIIPRLGCSRVGLRPNLMFRPLPRLRHRPIVRRLGMVASDAGGDAGAQAGGGAGTGAGGGAGTETKSRKFWKMAIGVGVGTVVLGAVGYQYVLHYAFRTEVKPDGSKIVRDKRDDGSRWREYGESPQGRRHGPFTEWYPDGTVKVQATYVDGDLHGTCNSWYSTGRPWEKIEYEAGKWEGPKIRWHPNGQLHEMSTYKNHQLNGQITEWDNDGKVISQGTCKDGRREGVYTEWNFLSRTTSTYTYKEGRLDGEFAVTDENDHVITYGSYKDAKLSGPYYEWHSNGKKKLQANYGPNGMDGITLEWQDDNGVTIEYKIPYKDDKVDGLVTGWYPDGKKKSEEFHRDGHREGRVLSWYPDGTKACEEFYADGKREGRAVLWNPDGKVTNDVHYKEDRVVSVVSQLDDRGRETVLPDGEIEVWKMCRASDNTYVYVQIRVPEEARRVTPLQDIGEATYKARVEYGVVVGIQDRDGKAYTEATSFVHNERMVYRVGEEVRPSTLSMDPNVDCGPGIHVHRHRDHCDQWLPTR